MFMKSFNFKNIFVTQPYFLFSSVKSHQLFLMLNYLQFILYILYLNDLLSLKNIHDQHSHLKMVIRQLLF